MRQTTRPNTLFGIALMIAWSFLPGLVVTLVGLIAFGGFAKGKWY